MHALGPGRVLLAFSGGLDSIGLAALVRDRDPLLGYVDHRLRGAFAARMERRRVKAAAHRLGLRLVRCRVALQDSSEASARRQRYRALHALARKHGCSAIATAHSADDRAESILFNLVRGMGLRGLAAPLPALRIGGLWRLRPALDERRASLRAAAAGFVPAVDRSNRSTAYARARIRTLWLPALRQRLGADPVPLLCALAEAAQRLRSALEARAQRLAPGAGRRRLLAEPWATFAYLVEALREPGPPLDARAYRALREFLLAGRAGRALKTPGGEAWRLEGRDAVRVLRT